MSAALQEPDDDEIKNALTDAGLSKLPTYAAMRCVLSNFVRLRKILEPAAQSPSQPLVEVQEPEIRAWESEDGRVISAAQKATALRDGGASASSVKGYTKALSAAAPVRGLPLTEVDWIAVGRILEAQQRLRGIHSIGTSNWGAAIWKAAHDASITKRDLAKGWLYELTKSIEP